MDPFGSTRSRVRDDHALICPDSFVPASLPGWLGAKCVVLVSPSLGARFVQYLALMDANGFAKVAAPGVEQVVYVLDGGVTLAIEDGEKHLLGPGAYAYLAANDAGSLRASGPCRLCVFEKFYEPVPEFNPPATFVRHEREITGAPFLGDPDARLQVLLPDVPAFDMAVNIFTYRPGATLPMVEVHVMEHGLLMLEGQGVYRLADSWYPVREGDAIWMAPYCPQWFVAMGKGPARYLYYKDVNRYPMGPGAGS